MQAELEDKADAKEDVSETETVSMVVTAARSTCARVPARITTRSRRWSAASRSPSSVNRTAGTGHVRLHDRLAVGEYLRDPARPRRHQWAQRSSPWRCPSSARATAPAARPPTALTARASRCISMQSSATRCPIRRPPSIETAATPWPRQTCSRRPRLLLRFFPCHRTCGHLHREWSDHPRALQRRQDHDRQLSASYYASASQAPEALA